MSDALAPIDSSPSGSLVERASQLIEQTRAVATQAAAAGTVMNWHIGPMIDVEALGESPADDDRKIVAALSPQSRITPSIARRSSGSRRNHSTLTGRIGAPDD